MSRLLKILKNRYVILVILVLSSYLYASVYQNIAMTPIDKIGTELQEVAKDPEFIREYEEVSSFTEEDLKQGLQKMGALKSKYLQGPILFFTACFSYLIVSIFSHLLIRLDEKISKIESRQKLLQTFSVGMISLYCPVIKYMLFSAYSVFTKTLIDYQKWALLPISVLLYMLQFSVQIRDQLQRNRKIAALCVGGMISTLLEAAFILI